MHGKYMVHMMFMLAPATIPCEAHPSGWVGNRCVFQEIAETTVAPMAVQGVLSFSVQ